MEIPEDIRAAAKAVVEQYLGASIYQQDCIDDVAAALLDERERCAKACAEYRRAFAGMPESVAKIASENASHIIENAITHLAAIRTPSTGEEQ